MTKFSLPPPCTQAWPALGMIFFPGGLARFIPCQPGAHYTRLIHPDWRQCEHGCDMPVIHALLGFFGYPDGALLQSFTMAHQSSGSHPLPFSRRFPSWPVQKLSSSVSVVGPSMVCWTHFLDCGPEDKRQVKRYRITGSFLPLLPPLSSLLPPSPHPLSRPPPQTLPSFSFLLTSFFLPTTFCVYLADLGGQGELRLKPSFSSDLHKSDVQFRNTSWSFLRTCMVSFEPS